MSTTPTTPPPTTPNTPVAVQPINQLQRLIALWVLGQLGTYIDPNTEEQVLGPVLSKRDMQLAALAILQAEQAADPTFLPSINLQAILEDIQ